VCHFKCCLELSRTQACSVDYCVGLK
jgi:hypothetical protein